jgi:hypothetical protein
LQHCLQRTVDPVPLPLPDGATLALVEAAAEALLLERLQVKETSVRRAATGNSNTVTADTRRARTPIARTDHLAAAYTTVQVPPANRVTAAQLSRRTSVLGLRPCRTHSAPRRTSEALAVPVAVSGKLELGVTVAALLCVSDGDAAPDWLGDGAIVELGETAGV